MAGRLSIRLQRPRQGAITRQSKGGIEGLIGKRVAAATEHALDDPNPRLMRAQKPVWDVHLQVLLPA